MRDNDDDDSRSVLLYELASCTGDARRSYFICVYVSPPRAAARSFNLVRSAGASHCMLIISNARNKLTDGNRQRELFFRYVNILLFLSFRNVLLLLCCRAHVRGTCGARDYYDNNYNNNDDCWPRVRSQKFVQTAAVRRATSDV